MPQQTETASMLTKNARQYDQAGTRSASIYELFTALCLVVHRFEYGQIGRPFQISQEDGRSAVAALIPDRNPDNFEQPVWPIGTIERPDGRYQVYLLQADGSIVRCWVVAGTSSAFQQLRTEDLERLDTNTANHLTRKLRFLLS